MSFFNKKVTREEVIAGGKQLLIPTGGRIDEIVMALISHAPDPDATVREGISASLYDVGRKKPELVLSSILDFLTKNPKAATEHRVILLKVMHQILELKRDEIAADLALDLVGLAMSEMQKEKEVIPEWQTCASQILVSLGMRFPKQIMEELMKRFTPGNVPHYFVMKTLGDFASANPNDVVPLLRETFARVLPVLASVKQDNMKWVFASGIGYFCDAILAYSANNAGKEGVPAMTGFSSEVFPAFEVMFSQWLDSKELRVRLAVVQAMGNCCAIMSRDTFETQLPRILPVVLKMFAKEKEHLPLAQGLCVVLEAAVKVRENHKDGSQALHTQMLLLQQSLFPLIVYYQFSDSTNPQAFKTSHEILRCFEIVGRAFPDPMLQFLLTQVAAKEPVQRSASLRVLRHYITRLDEAFNEDKRRQILSGLLPLVANEKQRRVKKVLAETIIAMASKDYLLLEGGQQFIEFIARNSAITEFEINDYEVYAKKKGPPEDNVSPGELRSMCDNILHLLTTTIPKVHKVLWPFMLELLVKPLYTEAVAAMCKSLSAVAGAKRATKAEDYLIDYNKQVNVPKPQAIVVRLLVMLNSPFRRNNLGTNILEVLRAIGPVLHPSVTEMWDNTLPKMATFLEKKGPEWNQTAWEDLTLRLLAETIKSTGEEDWNTQLGEQLALQFDLYRDDVELKRSALRHCGLVLQKLSHRDFIKSKLESMWGSVEHTSEVERLGFAQGIGFCGANHFDIALEKLDEWCRAGAQGKAQKEEGGLLGLFSSKPKGIAGPPVMTVILAYGYISAYAPASLLPSRMDSHILSHLKPLVVDTKIPQVREQAVKAIDFIGKAMSPAHLKKKHPFPQRDDLIKLLLNYMTPYPSPEVTGNVVLLSLNACATLTFLDPLPKDLETLCVERTINFYKLPPSTGPVSPESTPTSSGASVTSPPSTPPMSPQSPHKGDKNLEPPTNPGLIVNAFNDFLASILYMESTIGCLSRHFKAIEPFLRAPEAHCRERAMSSVLALLRKFVDYKSKETGEKPDRRFLDMGKHLAMILPRCTDPSAPVRRLAVEALQMVLYINHVLKKSVAAEGYVLAPPEELRPLTAIRDRMETSPELNEHFAAMVELSTLLASPAMVAVDELPDLLMSCLKGLTDPEARGAELFAKVKDLVNGFIGAMTEIKNDQTMNGTLHSLRSLAHHHLGAVLDELLNAPIPHPQVVVKSFQVIAKDEALVLPEVNFFTHILNNTQVIEDKVDPKNRSKLMQEHAPRAMSATCAFAEVMQGEELEEVIKGNYYLFAGTILLRFGTASSSLEATQHVIQALRNFIACGKDETLQAVMDQGDAWKRLATPEYYNVLTDLTRAICKAHPDEMSNIFQFLLPYLKGNYMGQRVVAATVFAEFINHTKNDKSLLQQVLNCLLASLVDPNVKMCVLIGLGNIGAAGAQEANKYAPTVLDALMSSIDDNDETIAMEAMRGLSKIFDLVEESRIAPTLVNICLRIRPAFEKPNPKIRSASFSLFGSLYRFGAGQAAHIFNEQIHSNLPALVLHLNDENPEVCKACKSALRKLGPLIGSAPVANFLVTDENRQILYDEFCNEFSKLLIASFPERINYYLMTSVEQFKSNWTIVRANAATFSGFLLGNLSPEVRKTINLNPAMGSSALIVLLKEKSPEVRKKAAFALSLLTHY